MEHHRLDCEEEAVNSVSDESVPSGWYPDPDGKPCARYWDGRAWTEQTRPLTPQAPQSQAPEPVAGPAGYCPTDDTFRGDLKQVMQYAARAIQDLRWTVVNANDLTQSLTFETKMSWGSWSGVTCTLQFAEVSPGRWKASGTGKQNVRGGQLVAMDFGEASSKARKAIERMKQIAPRVSG